METVALTALDPGTALQLLAGVEARDPRGVMTRDDLARLCEQGLCFGASIAGRAQMVYVLSVRNGQAWVQAAKGEGAADLTRTMLPVIELQCSELDSVGFQTARPGLVRKAQKQGYRVTGWMLTKELKR